MSRRVEVLHAWVRQVESVLPGERVTRVRVLALFAAGVLWAGSVIDRHDTSTDTGAIRALNAKLKADERVDLALFAVGDGMTAALKR